MSSIRVGVVGVGALGRHHARILAGLEGVELVAVADSREDVGRRVAADCGTRWVSDYRELIGEIDACSIAVPTRAHFAVAAEFLRRGVPAMVEKPLAADLEEAQWLVRLAEGTGSVLQVGHVERFNPAFETAAALCGTPKYIRAERVSPYAFRSTDIGAVHDLMIHDLDLILSLVESPLERVEAFGISVLGGHEDCAQARLVFADGCIADVTANRVCPSAKRTM
ncbi:MAG: Gfo/Idh/MocA family oxidoreductase [Planctomycetes bacterium]|nr:Gfo/Idh/MocA family oxidoreductase [Planctomycetota bacterium]